MEGGEGKKTASRGRGWAEWGQNDIESKLFHLLEKSKTGGTEHKEKGCK